MKKIRFLRKGNLTRAVDAAYVDDLDNLCDSLAQGVVESISTEIEIILGGKTIFLAMLLNPEHWEEDWLEVGVEDPYEFLAGLVEEEK
jgi:hypothetical protein